MKEEDVDLSPLSPIKQQTGVYTNDSQMDLSPFPNEFDRSPTQGRILSEEQIAVLRDAMNDFAPLERLFGTLTAGCAFGQEALVSKDPRQKPYNAFALTDTTFLVIQREEFNKALQDQEKRSL